LYILFRLRVERKEHVGRIVRVHKGVGSGALEKMFELSSKTCRALCIFIVKKTTSGQKRVLGWEGDLIDRCGAMQNAVGLII